ncbi:MAG: hypothetical protein ACSLE6_13905 [Mycobacterium sp.]
MGYECGQCREDIAHCHGTVIHHARLRAECTEDHCISPESVLHGFAVHCEVIGCVCAHTVTGSSRTA